MGLVAGSRWVYGGVGGFGLWLIRNADVLRAGRPRWMPVTPRGAQPDLRHHLLALLDLGFLAGGGVGNELPVDRAVKILRFKQRMAWRDLPGPLFLRRQYARPRSPTRPPEDTPPTWMSRC
jgi:hypothetical protein